MKKLLKWFAIELLSIITNSFVFKLIFCDDFGLFTLIKDLISAHVWVSFIIRLFQKKNQIGEVKDILFWNPTGIFQFFTLLPKILDKTKLLPWKFHKIVLNPLGIPRPKTKTPGNSTLFFLGNPWKFYFVFKWPLKIPHAISLILLGIPYPQPPSPCLVFFLKQPIIKEFFVVVFFGMVFFKVVFFAPEKILFNGVLILSGQHCTVQNLCNVVRKAPDKIAPKKSSAMLS